MGAVLHVTLHQRRNLRFILGIGGAGHQQNGDHGED